MAVSDISLKSGQIIVSMLTSDAAGISGKGILSGTIVSVYSNQGSYSVGDTISFWDKNSFQFTAGDGDVAYSLLYQDEVIFKINTLP